MILTEITFGSELEEEELLEEELDELEDELLDELEDEVLLEVLLEEEVLLEVGWELDVEDDCWVLDEVLEDEVPPPQLARVKAAPARTKSNARFFIFRSSLMNQGPVSTRKSVS